jgi:hypothetical protein
MKGPGKQGSDTVSEHGTAAVIFANRYAFAKAPRAPRAALNRPQLVPQLPLQPWTWLQLATIFCFTGSGKATKSSSAAI